MINCTITCMLTETVPWWDLCQLGELYFECRFQCLLDCRRIAETSPENTDRLQLHASHFLSALQLTFSFGQIDEKTLSHSVVPWSPVAFEFEFGRTCASMEAQTIINFNIHHMRMRQPAIKSGVRSNPLCVRLCFLLKKIIPKAMATPALEQ